LRHLLSLSDVESAEDFCLPRCPVLFRKVVVKPRASVRRAQDATQECATLRGDMGAQAWSEGPEGHGVMCSATKPKHDKYKSTQIVCRVFGLCLDQVWTMFWRMSEVFTGKIRTFHIDVNVKSDLCEPAM